MIYKDLIDFGSRIVKSLGMPEKTKGFTLRCYVDEIVTITCEYYPDIQDKEMSEFETVLAEYKLVKKRKCKRVG